MVFPDEIGVGGSSEIIVPDTDGTWISSGTVIQIVIDLNALLRGSTKNTNFMLHIQTLLGLLSTGFENRPCRHREKHGRKKVL